MMFKSRLAGVLSTLIISGSALANTPIPMTCPSVSTIQAAGLSMVMELAAHQYLVYNQNQYDTKTNWVMVLGFINAESEKKALAKGNKLLTRLSGSPLPHEDGSSWVCEYNSIGDVMANALFIEDDLLFPTAKFKQYFAK